MCREVAHIPMPRLEKSLSPQAPNIFTRSLIQHRNFSAPHFNKNGVFIGQADKNGGGYDKKAKLATWQVINKPGKRALKHSESVNVLRIANSFMGGFNFPFSGLPLAMAREV